MILPILTIVVLFGGVLGVELPAEIKKCSLSDPEFEECMKSSMTTAIGIFKTGSKEFGLPPLDPFKLQKLEITAEPGKSVALNQKYENVEIHGMSQSSVKTFNMEMTKDKCQWSMDVYSPVSRMEADYEMTGQVLIFPINGHGRCNVTLIGITNHHTAECEQYTKKGKTYIRMKTYKMNMSIEKAHFDFPNIVPGNEQISNEIQKTINENSLEIFADVKQGFEKVLEELNLKGTNAIFGRIPKDELFLK